ncbi:MAG TPA: SDR family oxidoreductase [Edaphobacter sp.]|jgi:NAD(P)-dependent dehydrogenase (short-subunit alcohol dehydrogenase family)|nr:SDR family oxidoreductase [Edaphobacter sp.]
MHTTHSKLKGKKVVILGGTSGFGLATAHAAADVGAEVIVASRSQTNIDKALAELPAGITGRTVDITDEAALHSFFTGLNGLDHLVITAGDAAPAFNPTTQEARQAFEVRFWGVYVATKAAASHIRPGGSITLTNGIVAIRPWKGWALTSAIAGAVESLTRGLALDLAPIRVNAVCAGVVKTPLWSGMTEKDREVMYDETASKLPVGRIGEPGDIAETFLYLMQSEFTTGQIVIIDGGAVIS